MGFCVARTTKGFGSARVCPAIETWRSAITSSSADCTFAGARLISSANTKLAKTGPHSISNSSRDGRHVRVPGDVGRHEVGGELQADEGSAHDAGERGHGQRLGDAGHAFEQTVPAGEKTDEGSLDHAVLAHDHALDLEQGVLEQRGDLVGIERLGGRLGAGSHWFGWLLRYGFARLREASPPWARPK